MRTKIIELCPDCGNKIYRNQNTGHWACPSCKTDFFTEDLDREEATTEYKCIYVGLRDDGKPDFRMVPKDHKERHQ